MFFCEYSKITDGATLRFIFDGQFITPEDTPKSLEMEDQDQVDVHLKQVGGRL